MLLLCTLDHFETLAVQVLRLIMFSLVTMKKVTHDFLLDESKRK